MVCDRNLNGSSPQNPYIPTVHLNYRYFEAGPVWWFGGGADLTPFYPYLSDTRHFHSCHKNACDTIDKDLHKVFKPWCDEYFFLKHRNETRGVGGIFYDYQDGSGLLYKGQNANGKASKIAKELGEYSLNWENLFSLAKACGQAFLPSYEPIIKKRKIKAFQPKNETFNFIGEVDMLSSIWYGIEEPFLDYKRMEERSQY